MSLSADAKDELAREPVASDHCRAALLDGLLAYGRDARTGVFRTQRSGVARLVRSLLPDAKRAITATASAKLRGATTYALDAPPPESAAVPRARCDRRMELRGAFLACGSLAAPARGYHLEFVPPGAAAAERLERLLRALRLPVTRGERAGRALLYCKGAELIGEVLATIGASAALLQLEDVRALKETKNRIRRLVNTEAANVDRATVAAAAQREAMLLLADAYGFANLAPRLREIAELRLANPTDTLAELGRLCSPPLAKSTVNGRIATLLRLARSVAPAARRTPRTDG